MPLTVHHLQVSQSERIPWLCEELSIPYTLKTYKRSPLLAPPELKSLTPMGAAPVIQDTLPNTTTLTLAETPACAEYIIHTHGSGRLALPPTHPSYPQYLYWFHFANGNLQCQMSTSFRLHRSDASPTNPIVSTTLSRTSKVLTHIDSHLSLPQNPWLAGSEFTAADIMTVFSLTTMRVFNPVDLSPYPNILDYLKRVGERPAYRRAMSKADPEMTPYLGAESPGEFMDTIGK
jgi:glutathione S-transferase